MANEFEHKCESRGNLHEPNEKQSNKSWTVYSLKCNKCGGRVKPSL